jgi:hypothetical protein
MPTTRVTYSDLKLAADWCASYEQAGDDDHDVRAVHRVASWLMEEAIRRQANADDRAIIERAMAETGRSRAEVVAALQRRRKRG